MQERRNDDSGLDRGSLPLATGALVGAARQGSAPEGNALETQAARKSTQRNQRGKPVRTPPPERELPAKASRSVPETPATPTLSDSERYRQIRLCAYFRAERRGFEPGHMWDDWLAAEREIAERKAAPREGAERFAAEQRSAESPSEKP